MSASEMQGAASHDGHVDWRDFLTKQEISELLQMRDWRSWFTVVLNWSTIFGAMALVAVWPNPLTVILALFVIGARQLGLAVLMHDASHHALFSNRRVNDWVGNWLAAYPVWSDMVTYRPYHLGHHARTWTDEDPDIGLVLPFPITSRSFRRKVVRDLTGRTGVKFARFSIRRDFGREGTWRERTARAVRSPRFRGTLLTNGVLLAIVSAAGHPALYLLWVGAYFTTNTLVTRIRAIAEHTMSPDPSDPLQNTRTTIASWWERIFIAPNRVNYHLEHHLLMTVPHYNLPRLHDLLKQRGALDHALVAHGYLGVLQNAASKAA